MWTDQQSKAARSLGWDVYDVHTPRGWKRQPLPLTFGGKVPDARVMLHVLVLWAKEGDLLARQALKHILEK